MTAETVNAGWLLLGFCSAIIGAVVIALLCSDWLTDRDSNDAEDTTRTLDYLAAAKGDDWSPETRAEMDQALAIAEHTADACDRIASVTQLPTGQVVPFQRKAGER